MRLLYATDDGDALLFILVDGVVPENAVTEA